MGQLNAPEGKFVQVSSGLTHACALRPNGLALCWGEDTRRVTSPPNFQFLQLSCHTHECCGIRLDGKIVCWGGNLDDELDFYVHGAKDERYTQVTLGGEFFCGVRENMSLRCWGSRQITNSMPGPEEEVLLVSGGKKEVCAILAASSQLHCWGGRNKVP